MKSRKSWLLAALIALWPVAQVQSQSDQNQLDENPNELESSTPLFDVEVLVFEHVGQSDAAYRWPNEPQTALAVDLLPPLAGGANRGDSGSKDSRFSLLPNDQLGLGESWTRLAGASNYRPLAHLGWRQPALDGGSSLPVRVRNARIISVAQPSYSDRPESNIDSGPVLEVDGLVTYEQRRYKHIKLDLAVRRPAPIEQTQMATDHGMMAGIPRDLEPALPYRTYRINDSSQVIPGRIQYFDHRQFGVLVRVVEAQ